VKDVPLRPHQFSRFDCLRRHHWFRSRNRFERQRGGRIKTEHRQNDRARCHDLLLYHLFILSSLLAYSHFRKGENPSQLIHQVSQHILQPIIQVLPGVGNDIFLPIMISRLMLSLRKAASVENGWSLTEMTTVRRVNEIRFVQAGNQPQTEFRMPRTEDFDQVSEDSFEEIGMAVTKGWEGPSVPGTV
jgi:hypothetical protein